MLPKKYQNKINSELSVLWSCWKGLGLFSNGEIKNLGIEEAFVGLCILGRFEQRLYDEGMSIIIQNVKILSLNKLKFWFNKLDTFSKETFTVSSELVFHESGDSKLIKITGPAKNRAQIRNIKPRPFFRSIDGLPLFAGKPHKGFFYHKKWARNEFVLSDNIPELNKVSNLNPWIKAKLTFGNGVIADTVVLVSSNQSITAPFVSQRTGYTVKSIWLVLRDLENAGWLISKKHKNSLHYSLSDKGKKFLKPFMTSDDTFDHFEHWIRLGFFIEALLKLPRNSSEDLIRSEELKIENELEPLSSG